ncbi:MAG: transcriptional regulator, putative ATPase, winged helix family [Actinomycetia bacterium]|nr:transcriptional regulator, putative ATPase, winged helix family [Actinomycetes bacterium]
MQFRILGPLEVLDGQRPVELGRPKQRAVLAVLLLHANQVVTLDRLIEELWGEQPPAQATASLQAYISNLRRALEPERPARTPSRVLVTQPPGYRLVVDLENLDAARFMALAEQGHRLLEAERPGPAVQALREALGLWRGPALADMADEPFTQAERQRLEELRLAALEDRLAAELALGGHAAAVAELGELVGRFPFRERLHGLLMLALYRSGRQAEALQAFQAARRTLGEELGIDPSPWLRLLEADILRQAPALDWIPPTGQAGQPPPVEAAEQPVATPVMAPPYPAGEGELVGRDGQLALLDRTLAGATAGQGRLVLVAGEPGIGKTRLAEEAARHAAAQDLRVVWGRCYQGEGAPAFWPWVQVARQLLAEVAPGELDAMLGPSAGELSQLLPELKELVSGMEPPPVVELAAARFRLYQSVTGLLRHVAAARPLLVVIDDLHWADTGSLELLAFLAAELRGARLVVLGTYRDVDLAAGQPLTETLGALARERVERIRLRGLGKAEVARLIVTTTGSRPPEELVRAVHDRTDGNPFFVTELLRLLQSEGTLQADDVMAAARRAIPVGVREVLQRRLARLPEQTNAVLLVAATAGRGFDLDLVQAVTQLDDERTLDAVEAAVIAGLVVEDEEAVGRYWFTHGLVQETLYEQLSRARRVRLHTRLAETLLGLHRPEDPEHVPELARHAWAAVPVMGAEAALPLVLAAADNAMARLAYEQAEQQLRRALELLASVPPSAERTRRELGVQVRLGNLIGQLSSPGSPEAAAMFERAVELASEVADDPAAIPALFGIHRGLTTRAELDRARALAERVMDGAQRSDDSPALLAGHYFLGQTLFLQGELVAAREHLEEAVRLAVAMPDASWLPGYPLDLGAAGFLEWTLVLLGLHDQAIRVAEAASERLEHSHPYSRALVIGAGVFAAVYRRDPALLRARSAAAAAVTEQWGFRMLAVAATAPLGWAQAIEGDPTSGAKMLREALAGWEAVGLRALRAQLLGLLAEAEQLAGRPDEALRLLDDALALVDRGGERYCEAELHRLKGESLLAMSPPRIAEAEAAFATSIAVARRQGAKLLEERATTELGRLRAARRPQSAR